MTQLMMVKPDFRLVNKLAARMSPFEGTPSPEIMK